MSFAGRCSTCRNGTFVRPSGPRPCRLAVIGEAPNKDEIRRGRPFAGRSGAELDLHYLPLAGLDRNQVFVTNALHCNLPGFRNPEPDEALACARVHLGPELAEVGPEVVITLGAVAASVFDTTYIPGGLGRPIDLEMDHGLPVRAAFGDWSGWLIPFFHPAAGMHQSRFIIPLREDFAALPVLLEHLYGTPDWCEVRVLPPDPFPSPHYEEIDSATQLSYVLDTEYDPLQDGPAIDTETDEDRPFSLQFCLHPGTAYLIDATQTRLVHQFARWIATTRPRAAFHHALTDLDNLLNFDPPVRVPRWVDTMMLAFHAQLFSHGLKPLAHRLLGMAMRDYDEVVGPPSIQAAVDYARRVESAIQQEFQVPHVFKSGKRKGETEFRFPPSTPEEVRNAYNRFRALVRDSESDDRPPDFNPWDRTFKWDPSILQWGEILTGAPLPKKSIRHVPRDEAIYYACRDADATLRLLPVLRRITAHLGRKVS